jgi:hypothetical protein
MKNRFIREVPQSVIEHVQRYWKEGHGVLRASIYHQLLIREWLLGAINLQDDLLACFTTTVILEPEYWKRLPLMYEPDDHYINGLPLSLQDLFVIDPRIRHQYRLGLLVERCETAQHLVYADPWEMIVNSICGGALRSDLIEITEQADTVHECAFVIAEMVPTSVGTRGVEIDHHRIHTVIEAPMLIE